MVPVGTVMPYAGQMTTETRETLRRDGYFFCDGAQYSGAIYPELYALIKGIYGNAMDGYFRVPDYRGVFLRGANAGRGVDPDESARLPHSPINGGSDGANVGSLQGDAFKLHQHFVGHVHHRSFSGLGGSDKPIKNSDGSHHFTDWQGGNETRPVNIYVNYIICFESFPQYDLPLPITPFQAIRSNEYGSRGIEFIPEHLVTRLLTQQINKVTIRGTGILDGIILHYANGQELCLGGTGGTARVLALAKGEYVTRIKGHYDATYSGIKVISRLQIETSGKQISTVAGVNTGKPFEIAAPPGHRIAGVYGTVASNYVASIGAYFAQN